MTARRMFAALLALASLAGCTADQTNRAIYDGLRRREELIRPDVDNRRFAALLSGVWASSRTEIAAPYVTRYLTEGPAWAARATPRRLRPTRLRPTSSLRSAASVNGGRSMPMPARPLTIAPSPTRTNW